VNSHGLVDIMTQELLAATATKSTNNFFIAITSYFLIFHDIPDAFFRY
jgi:ABC-type arginine transport system permease subunit